MTDDSTPRVPLLDPAGVPAEVGELFAAFLRERGNVPNLFRASAHRPAITTTLYAHMQAVMGAGTVPRLLKEMLAVRVSHLDGCRY